MPQHSFWEGLAGHRGQYNDLMFEVLRHNGYRLSNADMYAAWRADGFPELTPVGV